MMSAVSAVKVDLEHSCWSVAYLLAHCEGFRVESSEGTLGYLENVVWARDRSQPVAFRVQTGSSEEGVVTLAIDDVLELDPNGERLVVRARAGRSEPPTMRAGALRSRTSMRCREARLEPGPEAVRAVGGIRGIGAGPDPRLGVHTRFADPGTRSWFAVGRAELPRMLTGAARRASG
jgi:hypothetical protein